MSFPSRFGKFLLLERVNVGGMAEVFKAKTTGVAGFERILAIKRILPNLVEDDDFIRMFIDEARIAVQLNHANIVQIYELGKQGEHYYIAMEYIPSRDLRGILDRLRANGQLMPIAQAAHITSKVAEGLDYAHRRKDPQGSPMNIIHRDVSPQNILVGFEGEVKVIDFGIAKAANRASKTQAGVLKGKFGYMSPEQVRGLPIDRRSDIFAVGVLLYEMLTGERLFVGESDFSTLERVRNADVTPPTSFNKKISPQLEQIVLKTLAREVEDRYQWASELAHDLQAFVTDTAGTFNARRLSASMREMYAPEVALEKKKLEEFMRILPENVKERANAGPMSVLPLPQRGGLSIQRQSPLDDEVGEFGEDKTFDIEASTAGIALGGQETDLNLKNQPVKQSPFTANEDKSDEVSLYGDRADLSEDDDADARTLVGAENPYYAPPPAPAAQGHSGSRPRADAATRPMMPVGPPPAAKQRVVPPGRPFDAVAAAMAEDGDDDVSNVTGPFSPPSSMPTMSQLAQPAHAATPAEAWPPPQPSPGFVPRSPQVDRSPTTAEASGSMMRVGPPATMPMPWAALIGGVAASGVAFAAAVTFFVMRIMGAGEATPAELVLSAVGPVPADVVVSLDGVVVGSALPLTTPLHEGLHSLEIKGTGISLRREVVGTGGTVRQPILFAGPVAAGTDGGGGGGVAAVARVGSWRLLLAAVGDDGNPVDGAEVFVNGRSLGLTPLEAELDDGDDDIAVKIKKEGFTTHELGVKRAGRSVIGPATIALVRSGAATPTPTATTPPTEPVDVQQPVADPSASDPTADDAKVAAISVPVDVKAIEPKPTEPKPVDSRPPTPKPVDAKPTEPRSEPKPADPKPATPKPADPKPAVNETKPPESKTPPKTAAKVADIQLGTSPYADTTIDGRKYGMTPFFGPRTLTLPVGTHKIEFFDKVNNKKYRYQLKLKAPDPNNKVVIQFNKDDPPKVEGQVELKKLD